ncbi:MAG: T9SS type A sorting domain-containing protein [Bacteroidia bacterium]|nr:T9SS type A sorting domain-containing protein [Bacteroidia bacterium]
MRKIVTLLALQAVFCFCLHGQNLVPNPSFETITGCPPGNSGLGQGYAPPWVKPPGSGTTPDLFHSCSSAGTACGNCNVPNNFAGISTAFHGVAYAGIITYYTSCPNCREYIQVQLTSPLVSGNVYEVRCRTKPGSRCTYGTNRIGMHLSTNAISQPGNQPILLTPTYEHPGQVIDKTNWTLVKTNYVASGGESYLTIGNFNNNASTSVFNFGASGGSCLLASGGGTYYFDSVFVGLTTILPASNLDFQAQKEGLDVQLSWQDFTEFPPQEYVLEYAATGHTFSVLDKFEGQLHREASYDFLHHNPGPGSHFYRLKMLDEDGKSQFSEVRSVNIESLEANTVQLEIFPNPAAHQFTVRLQGGEITPRIQLTDLTGRIVFAGEMDENQGQVWEKTVNCQTLPNGIYLIRAMSAGKVWAGKIWVNN